MAATTVQDLMDAMTDHGFSDTATARKIELINDAYQDICSREAWPFLEKQATGVTVVGAANWAAQPADLGEVLSIVIDATSDILVPMRLDDLTKRFSGSLTTRGRPAYYTFVAGQIQLYPVPDGVYTLTISYVSSPAKLTAAGDTPVLPDRHARTILLGAVASAYDMEDDTDLAMKFDAKFEKRIATMKYDLMTRQFDRPDTVFDMFGFDDVWD
jgi:hypothetical protein